jgi:hypothetical protein
MFGLFAPRQATDPSLGSLTRQRGLWRGTLVLLAQPVPLAITGSRSAPDQEALAIARSAPALVLQQRDAIDAALLDHYGAYADADEPEAQPALQLLSAADTRQHLRLSYAAVTPLGGALTLEVGCHVAWDDEHMLGLRFNAGRLVELCGSVLPP